VKLLALDSATELCSAALWLNGSSLSREDSQPRASGERILVLIDALLAEAGLALAQLDAIAFGRGPGGFTGVRLATAVAQGLGFSSGLPLLPVSDLRAVAQRALAEPDAPPRVLVCQDARMRQVYWSCCHSDQPSGMPRIALAGADESVADPEAVRLPPAWQGLAVCGAGSGFEVYPQLCQSFEGSLAFVLGTARPRAAEIALLAAADGLLYATAPEDAQPVYLRDQVAVPRS
jgi:tRNA threonylcarbamoyladenosine biosynthesis protein TsaB